MKLSPTQRRWLHGTFAVLFVSGAAWTIRRRAWLLAVHGAAAMAFLVVFGALLATHVKKATAAGRNLPSGQALTGTVWVLILTGYALYYAGSDAVRSIAGWLHTVIGLAAPMVLAWHMLSRRGTRHARGERSAFRDRSHGGERSMERTGRS